MKCAQRARQHVDILCTRVRQLPMEDICVGVRQLQLGDRHLTMEDLYVGVGQLQLKYTGQSYTTPSRWLLFIGVGQLSMDECIKSELDNSNLKNVIESKYGY